MSGFFGAQDVDAQQLGYAELRSRQTQTGNIRLGGRRPAMTLRGCPELNG
jgi:hypothetical protein